MTIKSILSPIYHELRNFSLSALYLRLRTKRCGRNLRIGKHISVFNPKFLTIGKDVVINNNVSFFINPLEGNANLCIGNGVQLGKYNDFGCSNEIIIEDFVITAPFVHITDRDHSYSDINTPIMKQPANTKGSVIIKRGCWIGFGVQIMSGVKIGEQSVIAAGSIVTKDIPAYSVAAGNPARVVKRYNFKNKKWEKV